jgi:asparagine synthase (glutamine-hydrolysing)
VMWFASEMKALVDDCVTINIFPPGYYYTPETGFKRYYEPKWFYEVCTDVFVCFSLV